MFFLVILTDVFKKQQQMQDSTGNVPQMELY